MGLAPLRVEAVRRGRRPLRVVLSEEQRTELRRRVRAATSTQRDVFRARIILSCEEGGSAEDISERCGANPSTVDRWRRRFLALGLAGLCDRPRPGHKPKYGPIIRLEVIALACEPVALRDGRTRRTIEDLRQEVVRCGIAQDMSWSTVQRILSNGDLRPHKVRGWVHSPDPLFREKVTEITDLYLHPPPGSVVLSIDEKTGMQALERRFPDRPARPGHPARREFEYIRHGTQSLFCSFEVHRGRVIEQCGPTRTGADLRRFMARIAREYPNQIVHVIWDNLNIHYNGRERRWIHFNRRHHHRFVFHYTPKHASWVNQVELFFSILERECLRGGSFQCEGDLKKTVLAFIAYWNRERARPFRWTFSGYPLQSGLPLKAAS